jgi:polysaccharide export outer membrane protein
MARGMMDQTFKRRMRFASTPLVLASAGLLLLAAVSGSLAQQLPGGQPPVPLSGTAKIPPELLKMLQDQVDQGKISPEQMRQMMDAVQKGEESPSDVQKLLQERTTGTLTPEEIQKGRELLEEREKKKALAAEKEAKPPEAEKKVKPALEEPVKKLEAMQKPEFRIFGHELFSGAPSTFAPITRLPVSDEYVVGPGDEIKVLMWGRIDADYSLVVDNEGVIQFPKVGPLTVAGLTYRELKELIKRKAEAITGVNVSISMGRLRTIQVFVLGEVKSPGVLTVSSLATMTNAILVSGGPTPLGSLRQVQLKRNGRTVTTMDFYDLLLRGDTSHDARLMPGDVIFVPQAGPLVAVAGNVKRPATYELKDKRDLLSALELAGGLAPQAYNQRIQIERAFENVMRVILDVPYDELKQERLVPLQDGDLVRVFPILDIQFNAVYLYGNVLRPGKYAAKPGMKVLDVIPSLETLDRDTYLPYALIKRYRPDEMRSELIPFNLGRLLINLDSRENLALEPRDEVYVFRKALFQDQPLAAIIGEVRKPGSYAVEKMRIKDLIYQAGGLTRDAYLPLGHLYRTDLATFNVSLLPFNVEGALKEVPADNLLLQDRDEVTIHNVRDFHPEQKVTIDGLVNDPGTYPFAENMTVRDLILVAGNVKESAYLEKAELFRYQISEGKQVLSELLTFSPQEALAGQSAENLALKPFDRVLIKEIPKWLEERTATLSGEVRFPGTYSLRQGEKLSSVLARAGGFTPAAYLRGAFFTRRSARETQEKRLGELRERLEQEIYRATSHETQTALSREDVEAQKVQLEARQGLLKRLEAVKASGRVVVRLQPLPVFAGSEYDVVLEDGDELAVPREPGTVTVLGQVFNPTSLMFEKERPELQYYLDKTGGPTANAEEGQIYLVRADGSVVSEEGSNWGLKWDEYQHRWTFNTGFYSTRLSPGDTILVPEKIIYPSPLKDIKDITQILFQIAVTTGVVLVLF